MNAYDAVDVAREAMVAGLWLTAPILIAGLLTAMIIGFLQSLTQIHDATVAFIPKIVLIAVVIFLCLPWLFSRFAEYSADQFEKPQLINMRVGETKR